MQQRPQAAKNVSVCCFVPALVSFVGIPDHQVHGAAGCGCWMPVLSSELDLQSALLHSQNACSTGHRRCLRLQLQTCSATLITSWCRLRTPCRQAAARSHAKAKTEASCEAVHPAKLSVKPRPGATAAKPGFSLLPQPSTPTLAEEARAQASAQTRLTSH